MKNNVAMVKLRREDGTTEDRAYTNDDLRKAIEIMLEKEGRKVKNGLHKRAGANMCGYRAGDFNEEIF